MTALTHKSRLPSAIDKFRRCLWSRATRAILALWSLTSILTMMHRAGYHQAAHDQCGGGRPSGHAP